MTTHLQQRADFVLALEEMEHPGYLAPAAQLEVDAELAELAAECAEVTRWSV